MGFYNDLKEWEEYERIVSEAIYKEYWIKLDKNPNKKEVDLLHELFDVEVKFDKMANKTWNLYIEIGCSWADSWLFKSNFDIYIHWTEDKFFIFKAKDLRKLVLDWIEDGKFKVTNWGDWFRSKGLLLPLDSAEEYSIKTISL